MAIARYYDASKNPDEASLPGVPLADIDEETFAAYPEWLQKSIDALDMYRKTKPRVEKTEESRPVLADPVTEPTGRNKRADTTKE